MSKNGGKTMKHTILLLLLGGTGFSYAMDEDNASGKNTLVIDGGSFENFLISPQEGQGGSEKMINVDDLIEGYLIERGDDDPITTSNHEQLNLFFIQETPPEVPSLEELEFLDDPHKITKYCNILSHTGNCDDLEVQRKAELLAVKNLEKQQELWNRYVLVFSPPKKRLHFVNRLACKRRLRHEAVTGMLEYL